MSPNYSRNVKIAKNNKGSLYDLGGSKIVHSCTHPDWFSVVLFLIELISGCTNFFQHGEAWGKN